MAADAATVARPRDRSRPGGPILQPGRNCWRIAPAESMAVIVDAAAYFAAVKEAILEAKHSVFLIGWDFDWRIELERGGETSDVPDELGAFLVHIVKHRPHLRIFVLRWDMSFLRFPLRATIPLKLLDWFSGKQLKLRADHQHPFGGCHHQKVVVIDDCLAFCGGIDMTLYRWDTPDHAPDDPRRVDRGRAYDPWHDVTTCVDGEAARALGRLARSRWREATGEAAPPPRETKACWPRSLTPVFRNVDVAIARTMPALTGQEEIREIEALYLDAIAAARRTIYIESQYFASAAVAEALARRLREPDGPEVVAVNPKSAAGWLEEEVMGCARAAVLEDLRQADRHGRFRLYTPVSEDGTDIYVHAKVVVIDDRLLRVGSSNVNNRSMGLDTECDLAVEARTRDERDAITSVRDELVSEHLGVTRDELALALGRSGGSLLGAVEALRRPEGRTLAPFEPPALTAPEEAIARSGLLDPDRAEGFAACFERGWVPSVPGAGLRWGPMLGLGLLAAGGAYLTYRLRSRRAREGAA